MPARFRRKSAARGGFTLIELIVVILIILILVALLVVAILAIFGTTKKGVTKSAMEQLGSGWGQLVAKDEWYTLAEPRQSRSKFTPEFQKAANLDAAGGEKALKAEQKSMILALLLCSTRENFDRAMAKVGGKLPAYDPPVAEENSRSFRKQIGGWDQVVDGWGEPISYHIDIASASAGGAPKIIFMSGGEDKDMSTTNDNIYWSKDRGFEEQAPK